MCQACAFSRSYTVLAYYRPYTTFVIVLYRVKRGGKHPTEHRTTESLITLGLHSPPLTAIWVKCDSSKFSTFMLVTSNTFIKKKKKKWQWTVHVGLCLDIMIEQLTAHNWQKWKRVFLTCPCHKIYRDEAVGLKSCIYTWKIIIFVKIWNLGQYRENLIFCQ